MRPASGVITVIGVAAKKASVACPRLVSPRFVSIRPLRHEHRKEKKDGSVNVIRVGSGGREGLTR